MKKTPDNPKKDHVFACLFAIIFCLLSFGCKPKETVLSGQVFIVTRGSENIKLGLVDVFLIDGQQVTNFLQAKESEIASEQAAIKNNLDATEKEFTEANKAVQEFSENSPLTKPDYLKLKSLQTKIREGTEESETDTKTVKDIEAKIDKLRELNEADPNGDRVIQRGKESLQLMHEHQTALIKAGKRGIQWLTEMQALAEQAGPLIKGPVPINEQLEKIETSAKATENALDQQVETATKNREAEKVKLETFPSLDAYFASFFPAPVKSTSTDAEGKFSFTYPRHKPYAIFARAERMVGTIQEHYCWLVNAPRDSETATVLLSNHNLIFDDPDQFLKIKPKRMIEISQ